MLLAKKKTTTSIKCNTANSTNTNVYYVFHKLTFAYIPFSLSFSNKESKNWDDMIDPLAVNYQRMLNLKY